VGARIIPRSVEITITVPRVPARDSFLIFPLLPHILMLEWGVEGLRRQPPFLPVRAPSSPSCPRLPTLRVVRSNMTSGRTPGVSRKALLHRNPYSQKRLAEIEESRKERIKIRNSKRGHFLMTPKGREKATAARRYAQFYKVKVLNEKQHHCIALLSDFMNNWPTEYIIGQVGINKHTYYQWRNDPFFLKELDKEITRRRTMFRLEAHRQIFKAIRQAKGRGIKLLLTYLKMTGDLKEHVEISEKTTDDLNETQLDEQIQRLSDELGLSRSK
jgi:hypothetical protein